MSLSSSNFAAAMGINPYMSRQKLWRVMTGRENRDPLNEAMQWGIDNEFRAVAAAEAITGILFGKTCDRQESVSNGTYSTTPDGLSSKATLECKCPQKIYDAPPVYYIPQCQGQMSITDTDLTYFCAWTPDETRLWTIEYSAEYCEQMWELLAEFRECLTKDEQPKRRKKPVLPEIKIERFNNA